MKISASIWANCSSSTYSIHPPPKNLQGVSDALHTLMKSNIFKQEIILDELKIEFSDYDLRDKLDQFFNDEFKIMVPFKKTHLGKYKIHLDYSDAHLQRRFQSIGFTDKIKEDPRITYTYRTESTFKILKFLNNHMDKISSFSMELDLIWAIKRHGTYSGSIWIDYNKGENGIKTKFVFSDNSGKDLSTYDVDDHVKDIKIPLSYEGYS